MPSFCRPKSEFAAALLVSLVLASFVLAKDPVPVVVAPVTESEVKTGLRVVGTVRPLRTSTIGRAVAGRVQSFDLRQGDAVKQGAVVAQLRTGTIEIERAAAQAELELAVQRLAELRNGSLPEEVAEAEANMRAAEAALKNAVSSLGRIQTLANTRAASSSDLDDATQRAEAARFAVKAAAALWERIKEGPRQETIAQAAAQVELQQQRLNLINDRIVKSAIVAPFDGYISAEFTNVGAWIKNGDPIVEIVRMDEVEVEAPVTAETVVGLRRGDVIRVEFPELPDELFTGRIDRIVPVAATRARTYPVHIRIVNPVKDGAPLLLAGMLARVDLPAGKREVLPLVPKDALVLNGNDRSVFVLDSDPEQRESQETGVVRKVSVRLGIAVDDRVQVRGNIKRGDRVVVVGNERLIPNSAVSIQREVK